MTDLPVGFTYLFSRKVRIHSTRLPVSHQTGGCEGTSRGSVRSADRPVLPVIAFQKASRGPGLRAPGALGRRPGVRDAGEPRVRSRPGRVRSRSARSVVSAQPSLCTAIPGSHPRVPGGDHLDRPTGRHGSAASQEPLCPPVPIGRARVRRGRTRVDSPGPPSASHPVPSRPAASPIGVARPGGEPPHRRQRGVALCHSYRARLAKVPRGTLPGLDRARSTRLVPWEPRGSPSTREVLPHRRILLSVPRQWEDPPCLPRASLRG